MIVELYIYAFCLTVYFNGNVYLFAYLLLLMYACEYIYIYMH